ncbi:MAG: hypothetical protein IKL87_08945 [Oscillospiraceae bacterium]|nr:hypothetical protein [Oscillospiraceae bacterium]
MEKRISMENMDAFEELCYEFMHQVFVLGMLNDVSAEKISGSWLRGEPFCGEHWFDTLDRVVLALTEISENFRILNDCITKEKNFSDLIDLALQ